MLPVLSQQRLTFLTFVAHVPSTTRTTSELTLPSDYINPIDLCNRLNTYIIPEAGIHAFLTFLFLINGYWIALLLNLPLVAYNAKKWVACATLSKRPAELTAVQNL